MAGYYGFTLGVCVSIRLSVFSFSDDNLNKYKWVSTKLGMCIDIVEVWFRIANGIILSVFDSYLPVTHQYFCFWMITSVTINGFS